MNVGIIGSGTMGSGIAQVAATAGCQVRLYDTNQIALNKAKESLEKILNRLIEKGRIDAEEKTRIQTFSLPWVIDRNTLALLSCSKPRRYFSQPPSYSQ